MKKSHALGMALVWIGVSAAGWASQTADIPASVVPNAFHWTHREGAKVYHFDCHHAAWSAYLTNGVASTSEHGTLAQRDRAPFYEGLAGHGCWMLRTPGTMPETQRYDTLHWNYTVATPSFEHHAAFNDATPTSEAAFVAYVNSTLVGQEEHTLDARLLKTR